MMILQDHHEISDMAAEESNEKETQEKKIEDFKKNVELLSQFNLEFQDENKRSKKFISPLLITSQCELSIQLPPPELS